MEFTVTHSYPKDTETVFTMLTDQDYLEKKFEATKAINIEILECNESGNQFIIRNKRDIPSNPPFFARKILKKFNSVNGTDTWEISDGEEKKGSFTLNIKGAPAKMNGNLAIVPTSTGCDYILDFNVKVSIPLIGGKISKFIKEDTLLNQDMDYEFSFSYLENQ